MISVRGVAAAWNKFFYEPVSPLPAAVYRIALGLTLLLDAALRAPYATDFYGPDGIVSLSGAHAMRAGNGLDLLALLPQADVSVIGFFVLYAIAVVMMTAGLFTRVSAGLVFLGLASFHHRNPGIINGCDNLLRLMPLWLAFSPAGDRLSADAWLRERRGGARRELSSPWGYRMMQIQLSTLYVVTVLLKIRGKAWIDGTALFYVMRLPEFQRFRVPYLPEHLWSLKAMTWGTLVVESALGILVWVKECRRVALVAGVLLHLGIEYSMNLPVMQWANLGALTLFLLPEEIERALEFVRARARRWRGSPTKEGSNENEVASISAK